LSFIGDLTQIYSSMYKCRPSIAAGDRSSVSASEVWKGR
jgi:hypothetical protein